VGESTAPTTQWDGTNRQALQKNSPAPWANAVLGAARYISLGGVAFFGHPRPPALIGPVDIATACEGANPTSDLRECGSRCTTYALERSRALICPWFFCSSVIGFVLAGVLDQRGGPPIQYLLRNRNRSLYLVGRGGGQGKLVGGVACAPPGAVPGPPARANQPPPRGRATSLFGPRQGMGVGGWAMGGGRPPRGLGLGSSALHDAVL
jgi:hypothetical protein